MGQGPSVAAVAATYDGNTINVPSHELPHVLAAMPEEVKHRGNDPRWPVLVEAMKLPKTRIDTAEGLTTVEWMGFRRLINREEGETSIGVATRAFGTVDGFITEVNDDKAIRVVDVDADMANALLKQHNMTADHFDFLPIAAALAKPARTPVDLPVASRTPVVAAAARM